MDDQSSKSLTVGDGLAASDVRARAVPAPEPTPPGSFGTDRLRWLERVRPERRVVRGEAYRIAKRAMDLVMVVASLPLALLLLTACWLAVKAESPRARAVFVQWRTGLHGRRFRMLKFRTMVPEAEELKSSLRHLNQLRWPDFKIDNDPRITRVGAVLRRLCLDELPQLFNVLKGEMTFVGPRPTSFEADTYEEWQKARLSAVPGLTGLWQIAGRGSMEFEERVRLDLAYIERQSLSLDLKILLRTFTAVLKHNGPY